MPEYLPDKPRLSETDLENYLRALTDDQVITPSHRNKVFFSCKNKVFFSCKNKECISSVFF